MPRTGNLHRIVIDPKKPFEETARKLQEHQDRVRLALADPRTHLSPVEEAQEPLVGELLYQAPGVLKLAVQGAGGKIEYVQLYPVSLAALGLPQWFLDRLVVRQEELEDGTVDPEEWSQMGGV